MDPSTLCHDTRINPANIDVIFEEPSYLADVKTPLGSPVSRATK